MALNGNDAPGSDDHNHSNGALETPHNMHNVVASWFLGPQAENKDLLMSLFTRAVEEQASARNAYHPEDGVGLCVSIFGA